MSMTGLEDFCNRNYHSPYGELMRAFDYFLRAAGELMAMGYRVDTPIGSFAPRLKLVREITDPTKGSHNTSTSRTTRNMVAASAGLSP